MKNLEVNANSTDIPVADSKIFVTFWLTDKTIHLLDRLKEKGWNMVTIIKTSEDKHMLFLNTKKVVLDGGIHGHIHDGFVCNEELSKKQVEKMYKFWKEGEE